MGTIGRFACVFSLAVLLAAHGCSKRPPEGAADQTPPGAGDAEQADRKTPEQAETKLPPPLPDMNE